LSCNTSGIIKFYLQIKIKILFGKVLEYIVGKCGCMPSQAIALQSKRDVNHTLGEIIKKAK